MKENTHPPDIIHINDEMESELIPVKINKALYKGYKYNWCSDCKSWIREGVTTTENKTIVINGNTKNELPTICFKNDFVYTVYDNNKLRPVIDEFYSRNAIRIIKGIVIIPNTLYGIFELNLIQNKIGFRVRL